MEAEKKHSLHDELDGLIYDTIVANWYDRTPDDCYNAVHEVVARWFAEKDRSDV